MESFKEDLLELSKVDKKFRALLVFAIVAVGNITYLEQLIVHGTNVNEHSLQSITPLMVSAMNGDMVCAKLLIQNGANLQLKDSEGCTALIHACRNGHSGMMDLLLEFGALSHYSTTNTMPAVMWAIFNNHVDCLKMLIKHASYLDATDASGNTALMFCDDRSLKGFKLLLRNGADPNLQNKNGMTPLMFACYKNSEYAVKKLLKYGADPKLLDGQGNSALSYAKTDKIRDLISYATVNYSCWIHSLDDESTVTGSCLSGRSTCLSFVTQSTSSGM